MGFPGQPLSLPKARAFLAIWMCKCWKCSSSQPVTPRLRLQHKRGMCKWHNSRIHRVVRAEGTGNSDKWEMTVFFMDDTGVRLTWAHSCVSRKTATSELWITSDNFAFIVVFSDLWQVSCLSLFQTKNAYQTANRFLNEGHTSLSIIISFI